MTEPVSITFYGATDTVTGDMVRIDGFPGHIRTNHLISFRTLAFTGTILVEGSLVNNPEDGDWYTVDEIVQVNTSDSQTLIKNYETLTVWIRVSGINVLSGAIDKVIVR